MTSQRGPPASRHRPAKRRPIPGCGSPLPASSAASRLVAPSRGSQTPRLGKRRPGETTAGSLDRPASGRPTDLSKRGVPTRSYGTPIFLHTLRICQLPHLSRRLSCPFTCILHSSPSVCTVFSTPHHVRAPQPPHHPSPGSAFSVSLLSIPVGHHPQTVSPSIWKENQPCLSNPLFLISALQSVNSCHSYLLHWIVNSLQVGIMLYAFFHAFLSSDIHCILAVVVYNPFTN